MYSDTYAFEVYNLIEQVFNQNIHILNFLISTPNSEHYILSETYHNLCIIENIFLLFLYHIPISSNTCFINRVNKNLTILYDFKIKFSRYFSLFNNESALPINKQ